MASSDLRLVRLDRLRRAVDGMRKDKDTRWLAVADWVDFHRADLSRAGGRVTECESVADVEQAHGVAKVYLGEDL